MNRSVFAFASFLAMSAATDLRAQDEASRSPSESAKPTPPTAQPPHPQPPSASSEPALEPSSPASSRPEPESTSEPPGLESSAVDREPVHPAVERSAAPSDAPSVKIVAGPPPLGGTCSSAAIDRALATGAQALVRVEAPGGVGLGFVFHSPEHVVTALSVVDVGRGIRVVDDEGVRRDAVVVAIDRPRDLALLELEAPVGAEPLTLSNRDPAVGSPVLVLAKASDDGDRHHRWRGHRRHRRDHAAGGDTLVRAGIVSSRTGMSLRSDAIDRRHLSWGAPALDCDGRVVAVAISGYTDELVAASAVGQLARTIGDGDYAGRWSFLHPSLAVVGQVDVEPHPDFAFDESDKWLGLSLGTALIGRDRWYFPVRFAATFLIRPDPEAAFTERSGYRLLGSVGAGYRFMIRSGRVPIYLAPTVGLTGMYERTKLTSLELAVDPDCAGSGCPVQALEIEQVARRWRPLPTAGLGVHFGFGEVSYQFLLDPENAERSVHQLTVGAQW